MDRQRVERTACTRTGRPASRGRTKSEGGTRKFRVVPHVSVVKPIAEFILVLCHAVTLLEKLQKLFH